MYSACALAAEARELLTSLGGLARHTTHCELGFWVGLQLGRLLLRRWAMPNSQAEDAGDAAVNGSWSKATSSAAQRACVVVVVHQRATSERGL